MNWILQPDEIDEQIVFLVMVDKDVIGEVCYKQSHWILIQYQETQYTEKDTEFCTSSFSELVQKINEYAELYPFDPNDANYGE